MLNLLLKKIEFFDDYATKLGFYLLLVCTLAYLVIYFSFLDSSYIYDDTGQIVGHDSIKNILKLKNVIFCDFRRARVWQNISFAIDWFISGPAPWSFRITNIFLNLVNLFLFYKIAKKLFFNNITIIVGILCLALTSPLQAQSVNYIMGRISLIEAFFYFLVTYLALENSPRRSIKISLAILFSIPAKETCSLLIVWVLCIDLIYHQKKFKEINWKEYLSFVMATFLFIPFYSNMKDPSGFMHEGVIGFHLYPIGRYVLTQAYFYMFHWFLLFNPSYQAIIHGFPPMDIWILVKGGIGILLISGSLIFAYKVRKEHKEITLLIVFYYLTMAPTNSILQMINPFAEYRLYMANLCLFSFISVFLYWLTNKKYPGLKRLIYIIIFILCCFNTFFTVMTLKTNRNYSSVYSHALELYPTFPRLHLIIGGKLAEIKSPLADKFILDSYRLYREDPFPPTLMYDMVVIDLYLEQKKYDLVYKYLSQMPYLPDDIIKLCTVYTTSYITHKELGGTYLNYLPVLEKNFKALGLDKTCILYMEEKSNAKKKSKKDHSSKNSRY